MTGFESKRQAALDKLVELTEELRLYEDKPAPPPPECKTEAEQTAYAFGWWKALESVRAEQPAQEPDELAIAYMSGLYDGKKKRPWVGLTLDEIALIHANYPNPQGFALALQAKLKEKNNGAQ
jgi:hypothetical protein